MTIDRRLLAGALGVSLILAACGGSSTATTTPAPATTQPAATIAATPAPTTAPTGTAQASGGITPSFVPGAASDLEAMLPDEAAGVKYQKTSFDGATLGMLGAGIDTAELDPILKANGKTINDVRAAIAAPVGSAAKLGGTVLALQVKGVDATKFMAAMGQDAASLTSATVGGKQVLQAGSAGYTIIVYTKGDVLFEILLASDEVAAAIVSQLP